MTQDVKQYEIEKYLKPIWKGTTQYAESATILQDYFGVIRPIRFAYPIEKILSVKSFDLKTTYEEGKDYRVNEFGELEILPTGKIPYLTWKEWRYPEFSEEVFNLQFRSADGIGGWRIGELYADQDGMSAYTLAVTYTHKASNLYEITCGKTDRLPRFLQKLNIDKTAKVVSYGDSITYGWAASGMQDIKRPPYCPKYTDMVVEYLSAKFQADIQHDNLAVSGMCTDWGEKDENVQKVIDAEPDLVVLAFGMNDAGGFQPTVFYDKMLNIINKIRNAKSETEFMIVSPIMPNPMVGFASGSSICRFHAEYPRFFQKIEDNVKGVAYANVTAMHQVLLERKDLRDTLSNNINHPNDYMHRVYAQVMLKTMLGDEFDG